VSRRTVVVIAALALTALPGCMAASSRPPECDPRSSVTILLAQSVPTATRVPCLRELPLGWGFRGMRATDDGTEMWLSTDSAAGADTVTITFSETCEIGDAEPVSPTFAEAGAEVYLEMTSEEPITGRRVRMFEGGCVTSRYSFPPGSPTSLVREADDTIGYVLRFQMVNHVEQEHGAILCGTAAPPCEDG